MFDVLNKRRGWEDKSITGFSSDDLNEVFSMALEYSKKHQSVLILLCGSITENYDAFLNNLAVQMFHCGMIDGQNVEKKGLLQILSGDMSVTAFVREIAGTDNADRKLRYISSFHQMEYDVDKAVSLLKYLQSLIINGQVLSPVVLNMPMGVDQVIRDICPELWNHAIRYMKKSRDAVYGCQYQSAINSAQLGLSHSEDSIVGYDAEKKRDAPQSGYNTAARKKRKMEEVELPWYKKNLELLKTEKDGMTMLLKNYYNLQMDMAALPQSKRLYWKIIFKNMRYDMQLRIVYPESFSEKCLEVGIAIENADEKLMQEIRRNKLCQRTIYNDPELGRIFIIRRVYKRGNESSAAAALEGLIDLLYS